MYVFLCVYGTLVWYRNFLLQAASQLFAALNHYVALWARFLNFASMFGLLFAGTVLVHSNSSGSGLFCVLLCSTLLLCILSCAGGSLCRYARSLAAPLSILS